MVSVHDVPKLRENVSAIVRNSDAQILVVKPRIVERLDWDAYEDILKAGNRSIKLSQEDPDSVLLSLMIGTTKVREIEFTANELDPKTFNQIGARMHRSPKESLTIKLSGKNSPEQIEKIRKKLPPNVK